MERLSEYSDLEPEADWRKENIIRQSDGTWMKKVNYHFDLNLGYILKSRLSKLLIL